MPAMRKMPIILLLLIALVLAVSATSCGGGSAAAGDVTPQQALASALAAGQSFNRADGTFDLSLKLDADTSQVPEGMKALFDNPITLSGTYVLSNDPEAADLDLDVGLAGETLNFGIKSTGGAAWVCINGQWYETPSEFLEAMGQAGTEAGAEVKLDQLLKAMADLGIDPTAWMKDMTISDKKLDGVDTYYIKGTPDIAKIMTDAATLMQSQEFMEAVGAASEAAGGLDIGGMISPSLDELQEAQDQLTEVFKDTTVELWIGKDDSLPRQVSLKASIVPPAEEAAGLNSVTMEATVVMNNVNEAVSVDAPESPLPFTELERLLEEDPAQILGPLGGLLAGMSGGFGGF